MRWVLVVVAMCVGCDADLRFEPDPPPVDGADAVSDGAANEGAVDAAGPCKVDSDCPFSTLHCDPGSGACVACVVDAHCSLDSDAHRCDTASHRCVECGSDTDCDTTERCDPGSHRCLHKCVDVDDCSAETPVCEPSRKVCICTATSCSSGDHPRCDSSGACVACLLDADCPVDRRHCVDDRCAACKVDSDCADAKRCEPVKHECVD